MRAHFLTKLIFLPFLLIVSFLTHADSNYSNVFIFGDSLSDTGNLASVAGDFPAPYYNNRVSNGPLAVDILTEKLGHNANASLHLLGFNAGGNYSVVGAKAVGNEAIDLYTQVLSFQANHGFVAPADALYIIFIGGNDVRSARDEPDAAIAKSIIQSAVTQVHNTITALGAIGARSFLVINSADIAAIPETSLIAVANNDPGVIDKAHYFSKLYKKLLHNVVEKLDDKPEISIKELNLFKYFTKVIKSADKLGFTNTTDACFSSITFTFHPDCNYGLNADQFIFFDEIHPTARIHAMFGENFYDALNKNHTAEVKIRKMQ